MVISGKSWSNLWRVFFTLLMNDRRGKYWQKKAYRKELPTNLLVNESVPNL